MNRYPEEQTPSAQHERVFQEVGKEDESFFFTGGCVHSHMHLCLFLFMLVCVFACVCTYPLAVAFTKSF